MYVCVCPGRGDVQGVVCVCVCVHGMCVPRGCYAQGSASSGCVQKVSRGWDPEAPPDPEAHSPDPEEHSPDPEAHPPDPEADPPNPEINTPVDRKTLVKTLPCPKLHLRAKKMCIYTFLWYRFQVSWICLLMILNCYILVSSHNSQIKQLVSADCAVLQIFQW